jgi:hypothetical protein
VVEAARNYTLSRLLVYGFTGYLGGKIGDAKETYRLICENRDEIGESE